MHRRTFFAAAAGLASGALVGAPRLARAAWGSWPADLDDLQLAPERRAKQVLELFLYGGLCPWDTFYCMPNWGLDDDRYLYAFGEQALLDRLDDCNLNNKLTRPFAADSKGSLVHLGPWTAPLWGRPDILSRARVIVGQHDQFPHATAIPLALTGHRLGRPELAGTAATVARHFAEAEGGSNAGIPRSCVIRPGDTSRLDNVQSALSIGQHPGSSRPIELNLDQLPHLLDLLDRPATSAHREAYDNLLQGYHRGYTDRLLRPSGTPLHAPERVAWNSVDAARRHTDALQAWIPLTALGLDQGSACGQSHSSTPRMAARLARHLLTSDLGIRYALWIDSGLAPSLDGGHDSHREHLQSAATNYSHTFETLAAVIADGGDDKSGTINLNETMVVITSEFGRTPYQEDERAGLGHWPQASVSVLLGGPIDAPSIYGAIDRESGLASVAASPTELRMAILMALGIYPFAPGSFVPSDVRGATDPRSALLRLRTLLGVAS